MSRRTSRCFSRTFVLIVAVLFVGASAALAQHTTGVSITKSCPALVAQGDTYQCTYSLQNQDPDHGVINLVVFDSHPPVVCPSGQFTACAGEVQVDCTGGLTATSLAKKNDPGDTCTGTLPDITAPVTCSTEDSQDIDQVRAVGNDETFTALTITGSTQNGPLVSGLTCPAAPECNIAACVPGATLIPGVTGCITTAAENSTPCVDTDANACTTAGCEAGACVQTHNETVCTPDNNECTDDPVCNPATGLCAHPPVSDSTPCTDTDANACTTAGCEAGACVQAHQTTTCTPDNNECTDDPACNPSTGLCDHPPVSDSTPCTDTDADACTTAGCEAGACVQAHITDPNCNVTEICRTPGFWGTHAGTEKINSSDITGTLLTAYSDANGAPLSICGVDIVDSADAMNAICVSPKGDSRLQLARQLTSTALNCIITNAQEGDVCTAATGDVCAGVSIAGIFDACNTACADGFTSPQSGDFEGLNCISALDCFNNGGVLDESGECVCEFGVDEETGECLNSCHSQPLSCGNFQPAAGSPKACTDARKDGTTIFP